MTSIILPTEATADQAEANLPEPELEFFRTGNPPAPGQPKPGFLLMGGGGDVDDAMRWFLGLAGGGDVVVLRAAGSDGYNEYFFSDIGGINSVTSIVMRSREAAADPSVLAAIEGASAIYIAGGDQAKYYAHWDASPLADAVAEHVRAGKPLGGTSAGLAVLGGYSYSARNDTVYSDEALADPFHERVTLEPGMFDIPLLAGILTDSHFGERARLGRLIAFLARLEAGPEKQRLIGIGIDERTALCIDGVGNARVFSAADGNVTLVRRTGDPAHLRVGAGQPLATGPVAVRELGAGTEFALADADDLLAGGRLVEARDGALHDAGP